MLLWLDKSEFERKLVLEQADFGTRLCHRSPQLIRQCFSYDDAPYRASFREVLAHPAHVCQKLSDRPGMTAGKLDLNDLKRLVPRPSQEVNPAIPNWKFDALDGFITIKAQARLQRAQIFCKKISKVMLLGEGSRVFDIFLCGDRA